MVGLHTIWKNSKFETNNPMRRLRKFFFEKNSSFHVLNTGMDFFKLHNLFLNAYLACFSSG